MSELVQRIRSEVDALTRNVEFRNLLRQEETWLQQAQRTVTEVRHWRDREAYRFWPGVARRWMLALAFALLAVWSAGAGYAWVTNPWVKELPELRARLEKLDFIEQRAATLTPAEQRQLDALMKWPMSLASRDNPIRRSRQ